MEFECSECGLCCRNAPKIAAEAREGLAKGDKSAITRETAKFPYGAKEDGFCEKLGTDGKCTVYDTRPDICNVQKSFETVGKGMTIEQYYSMQGKCCNYLIKTAGLNDKFRVKENY